MRPFSVLLAAALCFSLGCGFQNKLKAGNKAVDKFHSDLNAQGFDDIDAITSLEYRRASTEEFNRDCSPA
jgi:hypothetical protein